MRKPHHIQDILFTEDQIRHRIDELVEEMAGDLEGRDFVIIGILRGSFMFLADLVRNINRRGIHPRIDFTTLESYHGGTASTGNIRITKDISVDVNGSRVLLVDDILDTGRTLRFARMHLLNKGAEVVKSCTLLDKPSRREATIEADYVGFTIDDFFVVGYGLDYDSYYRELPYISKVTLLESGV